MKIPCHSGAKGFGPAVSTRTGPIQTRDGSQLPAPAAGDLISSRAYTTLGTNESSKTRFLSSYRAGVLDRLGKPKPPMDGPTSDARRMLTFSAGSPGWAPFGVIMQPPTPWCNTDSRTPTISHGSFRQSFGGPVVRHISDAAPSIRPARSTCRYLPRSPSSHTRQHHGASASGKHTISLCRKLGWPFQWAVQTACSCNTSMLGNRRCHGRPLLSGLSTALRNDGDISKPTHSRHPACISRTWLVPSPPSIWSRIEGWKQTRPSVQMSGKSDFSPLPHPVSKH